MESNKQIGDPKNSLPKTTTTSMTGRSPVEAKRDKILHSGNKQAINELNDLDSKLNQFRNKAANIHQKAGQRLNSPNVAAPSNPAVSTIEANPAASSKAPVKDSAQQIVPLSDSNYQNEKDAPLERKWFFYYDRRGYGGTSSSSKNHGQNYENNLIELGHFQTIAKFWQLFNNIKSLGELEMQSNVHLFKDGIKPMWEDPINAAGGNWTFSFRSDGESVAFADKVWMKLCAAAVGELIDSNEDITGIVLSKRQKGSRISVWLRNTHDDHDRVLSLGAKVFQVTGLAGNAKPLSSAEFTRHADAMNYGSWAQKSMSNIASEFNADTLRQYISQKAPSLGVL